MSMGKVAASLAALALAFSIGACSGPSSYAQELLDEVSGIRVDAENANDSTATTEGALTVGEGDVVVISPFTDKGSFHVTITATGTSAAVYDDDVSGKVMFTVDVAPGTYDVATTGNGVTGWMTVFAQSTEELESQDQSLSDALAQEGANPGEEPTQE